MTKTVVIVTSLAATLPSTAVAFPHLQLTTGTATCAECHHAPAGGGLLTEWGRDESADALSRGGNGRLLHAIALPEWIAVGGDIRLATLAHDTGGSSGTELAAFPMQADVGARLAYGEWSVTGTVGYRGQVRSGGADQPDNEIGVVESTPWTRSVISREHFFAWRDDDSGAYVRAGRFFAPHGLRLVDHTSYIRRHVGFNLLQETYGIGGGWITDAWEIHLTGFVSDPWRGATREESGGAVMAEIRGDDTLVGASVRVGKTESDLRASAGVHAKWYWSGPELLWQAQLDGVAQRFEVGENRWQLVGYLGPTWMPLSGLYLGAAYEVFDADLAVRNVGRHALGAWIAFHPWAHVEIRLSGRTQRIGHSDRAHTAIGQLHYYL